MSHDNVQDTATGSMTAKTRIITSLNPNAPLACAFLPVPGAFSAQDRPPIGVKAGEMYPDYRLPTLDGELHRFSEYRGKKILLFHFASW